MIREDEGLRIIPKELWEAVRERRPRGVERRMRGHVALLLSPPYM